MSKRLLFAGISTMRDHAGQHKLYFIADAFGRIGIPVSVLVPDFPENREFLSAHPHIEALYYPSGSVSSDIGARTRVLQRGDWSAVWVVGVGLRSWMMRKRRGGPPIIKDFDEFPSMIDSFGPMRRAYLRWIEQRMIVQADGFTCASEFLEQTVRRRLGRRVPRLLRLPVAISEHEHRVDPEKVARLRAADGNRPVLLYIGSLNRFYEDQLNEVMSLAAILRARGSPAIVRILGGGPDEAHFKAQALAENAGGTLQFAGHVNRADLASHMDAARVLLFPFPASPFNLSRCPTKAFHYAAANRPIVTNRTGEVAALLGDSASYYPEHDVEALAAACERLLAAGDRFDNRIPFASLTWRARAQQFSQWLGLHNWSPASAPELATSR